VVILPLLAHLAQIGTDMLLTITNTSDELIDGVNTDNLE